MFVCLSLIEPILNQSFFLFDVVCCFKKRVKIRAELFEEGEGLLSPLSSGQIVNLAAPAIRILTGGGGGENENRRKGKAQRRFHQQ